MIMVDWEKEGDDDAEEMEPDLPPEFHQYRDEGCALAPACLECPFPRCLYEENGGHRRWLKRSRDREIGKLYYAGEMTVAEIAARYSTSTRTVQRALKDYG